jgi:hypothetical protein
MIARRREGVVVGLLASQKNALGKFYGRYLMIEAFFGNGRNWRNTSALRTTQIRNPSCFDWQLLILVLTFSRAWTCTPANTSGAALGAPTSRMKRHHRRLVNAR